ncbi:MAG: hypothetical protein CL704_01215 [Chloroflexi bacterium]|nr:hypothetical protein [Chloroflexota bacterium]|tara:strand:- start:1547 stop:2797 length:1251 start_codon:yes stop_codon:yes gene_type:complete
MKFKYKSSEESSIAYYGWIIALYGNFIIALSSLTGMHGTGFFLKAFESKYNWSRTLISGASAFARAETALFGPVEGFILDKFGARKVMTIGFVVSAFGFYLLSSTTTILSLYISYIFMSFGTAIAGWLPIITLMNAWFDKKKTFAMAMSMNGVHFAGWGAAVLAFSIQNYGIRQTTFVIALIFLCFSPLSYLIVRDKTIKNSDTKINNDKSERKKFSLKINLSPKIKYGLTHKPFWMISIAHMSSTASVVTLGVHLPAHITDIGYSTVQAGYIVMVYSTVGLFAQIIGGYLGDRLVKKYVLTVFLIIQSFGLFILSFVRNISGIIVFSIVYGVAFGGRNPLFTSIRGDYFDRTVFATFFGFSGLIINIGTVTSPVLTGYLFDTKGDYSIAFFILGIMALIGAVLSFSLPKKGMIGS